ncbi:hypothetical protein KI387_008794, partial [Taxus chinensis]
NGRTTRSVDKGNGVPQGAQNGRTTRSVDRGNGAPKAHRMGTRHGVSIEEM